MENYDKYIKRMESLKQIYSDQRQICSIYHIINHDKKAICYYLSYDPPLSANDLIDDNGCFYDWDLQSDNIESVMIKEQLPQYVAARMTLTAYNVHSKGANFPDYTSTCNVTY